MADRIQTADFTRCRKRATDVEFEVCLDHFSHMIATWSKDTVGHQQLSGPARPANPSRVLWVSRSSFPPSVCCSAGVPPAAQPTRVAGSCGHCKLLLSRPHRLFLFTARSCTPYVRMYAVDRAPGSPQHGAELLRDPASLIVHAMLQKSQVLHRENQKQSCKGQATRAVVSAALVCVRVPACLMQVRGIHRSESCVLDSQVCRPLLLLLCVDIHIGCA